MKRRAVIVRCGWGAAVVVCAWVVLAIAGGQDQQPLSPASLPPPGSLVAPRLPAYPGSLAHSPDLIIPNDTYSAPPREYPATASDPRFPVPPTAPVIPASGMSPIAPTLPSAPTVPPSPVVPALGTAPIIPPATVTQAGPIVPQSPVIPVASPVTGAPTAPTVPVPTPTMAQVPGVQMPISPAAYLPQASTPPKPLIVPAATHPAPTSVSVPPLPPQLAAPARPPIHPSQPATFPLPPVSQPNPAVLPTPTVLQPQPPESAQNFGTTVSPHPMSSGPGADGTPLNDHWRYGLRFESVDKDFSIWVGGRFQFDVVNYLASTGMRQNIPGNVPLEDGVSFRRFRLDMGGTLYKNMEYFAQVDFFNGFVTDIAENRLSNVPAPTDLWVQFTDLPLVGSVRVGNQKQLYGFEHLTSSRFLNFLERSLGFDAFAEGFNNGFAPGITLLNTFMDKRGTVGIGFFKNTRSPFAWNVGRNEAEVNGRVTFLPIYAEDGKYLVHMGVGGAFRDLDDGQARYRSRLDARNSPSAFSPLVAETGLFYGSNQQLVIPELVMVAGPWSFQSEYYAGWVQNAFGRAADGTRLGPLGTVFMQSAYGEVHYFLTGEHREYNRDAGTFTRVVPKRPLAWSRCGFTGCGAWQLAARYSYLDLIDTGINGGRVHDMTLGLNWFLNPNMKVQWNYFLAHRNVANPAGDGFIQGFATRLAIDF